MRRTPDKTESQVKKDSDKRLSEMAKAGEAMKTIANVLQSLPDPAARIRVMRAVAILFDFTT